MTNNFKTLFLISSRSQRLSGKGGVASSFLALNNKKWITKEIKKKKRKKKLNCFTPLVGESFFFKWVGSLQQVAESGETTLVPVKLFSCPLLITSLWLMCEKDLFSCHTLVAKRTEKLLTGENENSFLNYFVCSRKCRVRQHSVDQTWSAARLHKEEKQSTPIRQTGRVALLLKIFSSVYLTSIGQ